MYLEKTEIQELRQHFANCSPLFIALGDECRQKLILDIVDAGDGGINVKDLTSKSHLSRPAISHHLKVLKDCGVIKFEKVGTQIFYRASFDDDLGNIEALIRTLQTAIERVRQGKTVDSY